ncbi:MAG: hypothetical protein Q8903_14785 [Bacteroidota bacterium]|nr:hypothetical protein [Bacteroidota bacterium]
MKKGAQITALAAAGLWFVLQMYNVINQIITNDGIRSNFKSLIDLCIANLPGMFFSATICAVFIADLAHKTIKHESILYIIAAILCLPTIIQGSINLFNLLVYKNHFLKPDLQTFTTLGIDFSILLLWILVFVYLTAMVLHRDKLKKVIVPLFMVSIIANLVATLLQYFNPVFKFEDLWFFLLITLLIFILLFLAISGFMLRGIKASSKTEEIA